MLNFIKNRLRQFRRNEDGSIIAETVIMFPTLFAALLATFVFFDAFRNQAINTKANYTIADDLSRKEEYVTNTYMVNVWTLHRFLTASPSLTRLRISVIEYDAVNDSHNVTWSRAKGGGLPYDDADIAVIGLSASDIPVMPNAEILIVVQTEVDYEPRFTIGLGDFTFSNTTYTRHRWSSDQLCYSHNDTHSGRVCPGDST